MGATFNRIKTWINETLTASDVNAEFDNILTNMTPTGIDDASANVTAMQVQVDPGEVGSESLATNLSEEISRLRFEVAAIKGTTYWYTNSNTDLASLSNAIGGGIASTRIISGASTSSSSQPAFLDPAIASGGVTVLGASTNFVYTIDATTYTIDSDLLTSGLASGPTTNNTALINDALAADQDYTKNLGMYGSVIQYDTAGSEITSKDGQWAAFKLATGAGNEYFLGRIDDTNNQIKDCMRGCFFDGNQQGIDPLVFSNNDTLTIMRLTWVFANTSEAVLVSYTNPRYSGTEPGSPTVGDYWFDLTTSTWKTFNSVAWVDANAILLGICIQDENGNTVGARSFDFFKSFETLPSIKLDVVSNTEVRAQANSTALNVYGSPVNFANDQIRWNITTDLADGLSEAINTDYHLYITESGEPVMDTIPPLDMRGSRIGWFHPHETWRYVGKVSNDGSSNLDATSVINLTSTHEDGYFSNDQELVGSSKIWPGATAPTGWALCQGATYSTTYYKEAFDVLSTTFGSSTDSFDIPDLRGRVPIGVGTGAGLTARTLSTEYGEETHGHQVYDYTGLGTNANIYDSSGAANSLGTNTRSGGNHLATGATGSADGNVVNEDFYTSQPSNASLQPSTGMNFIVKVGR
jgi:microcystin-dependent protein